MFENSDSEPPEMFQPGLTKNAIATRDRTAHRIALPEKMEVTLTKILDFFSCKGAGN